MSFKIKIHGKVGVSLQNVGRQEIEAAVETLESNGSEPTAEAVHSVRKRIKKLRAIALLIRSAIGTKTHRKIDRALRDVGRALGGLRDARTRTNTLHKLQVRFFPGKRPASFRALDEMFAAEMKKSSKRYTWSGNSDPNADALRFVLAEFGNWDLDSFGWGDLRNGIRRSHKRARAAFEKSGSLKEHGRSHEWRKRVKELWYHVLLIRRVSPDAMEELAQDLEILAEFLGDDHDLVVLRSAFERVRAKVGDDKFVETLFELIDLRRGELLDAALDLCGRIFDEPPGKFVRGLDAKRAEHRKRKRKEKRLVVGLAQGGS